MKVKTSIGQGSTLTLFLGGPIGPLKSLIINFSCPNRKFSGPKNKKSEMNGGNIRLRMTLKINAGCLSLASEN